MGNLKRRMIDRQRNVEDLEAERYKRKRFVSLEFYLPNNNYSHEGSGCGSVGRAVTSETRDPRFKSNHHQILFYYQQ